MKILPVNGEKERQFIGVLQRIKETEARNDNHFKLQFINIPCGKKYFSSEDILVDINH